VGTQRHKTGESVISRDKSVSISETTIGKI
jgi:hypothetical protein